MADEGETREVVGLEVVEDVERCVVVVMESRDAGEREEAGEDDDGAGEVREEAGAGRLCDIDRSASPEES